MENTCVSSPLSIASDGLPQGWFTRADARLYTNVVSRSRRGRIVEVGTWLGRSLATILPTALDVEAAVWCVDKWEGSPNDETREIVQRGFDPFAVFRANMMHIRFWGSFSVIREDHVIAARDFADGSLDVVFLDADHSFESVSADIGCWWPKVKRSGLLLGHDYGGRHTGVKAAVDERFGRPQEVSGSTWAMQKS